jgi:hypothetical protein
MKVNYKTIKFYFSSSSIVDCSNAAIYEFSRASLNIQLSKSAGFLVVSTFRSASSIKITTA